jgi:hypothetical protein
LPDFRKLAERVAIAISCTSVLAASWAIWGRGGDLWFAAACFAVPLAGLNAWLIYRDPT